MMQAAFFDRLRFVADTFATRREAAAAANISPDQLTRYLRGENQPTFQSMNGLCAAARISLVWLATGNGAREADTETHVPVSILTVPPDAYHNRSLPVLTLAESGQIGWYDATQLAVSTTLELPDPQAFAVVAQGLSLAPEGIQPGFLCVCSPLLKPLPRDIVHLQRSDGRCTLMQYVREDADWLYLQAYLDPDKTGRQAVFNDQLRRSTIEALAPVVIVKRRL